VCPARFFAKNSPQGQKFSEKALAAVPFSKFHPLAAILDDRAVNSAAASLPFFSSSRQRRDTCMVGNVIAQQQRRVTNLAESQQSILRIGIRTAHANTTDR
jgi:hypothetical protein